MSTSKPLFDSVLDYVSSCASLTRNHHGYLKRESETVTDPREMQETKRGTNPRSFVRRVLGIRDTNIVVANQKHHLLLGKNGTL